MDGGEISGSGVEAPPTGGLTLMGVHGADATVAGANVSDVGVDGVFCMFTGLGRVTGAAAVNIEGPVTRGTGAFAAGQPAALPEYACAVHPGSAMPLLGGTGGLPAG